MADGFTICICNIFIKEKKKIKGRNGTIHGVFRKWHVCQKNCKPSRQLHNVKIVIRNLWESCEKIVKNVWENCEKVVKKLSESCQNVLRKLSKSCEKDARKMWESCEKVVRKLWESCD